MSRYIFFLSHWKLIEHLLCTGTCDGTQLFTHKRVLTGFKTLARLTDLRAPRWWLRCNASACTGQDLHSISGFDLWGQEDPLEEGVATHSSILTWRIPMDRGAWRGTGAQRVRHAWATKQQAPNSLTQWVTMDPSHLSASAWPQPWLKMQGGLGPLRRPFPGTLEVSHSEFDPPGIQM